MRMSPPLRPSPSVERQLLSNQLWETIGFVAKAIFVVGLTPWMIRIWGANGYGEYALASSTFVLLAILDLGIRARTRVALCRAHREKAERPAAILGESLAAFGIVSVITMAVAFVLSWSGLLDRVFRISPANHYLLFVTTVMSLLVLISGLLLEPLIAAGRIGRTKLATAFGWLLATPGVALVLWREGTVTAGVFVWLACLVGANVAAIGCSGIAPGRLYLDWCWMRPHSLFGIVREGFWFNAANVAWLTKTYGATFIISALEGPVAAGYFFILLRLSEIISALGAISSDLSMAEIARATTITQRRYSFASSYSWAVLFCSHSALIIGFFTSDFLRLWLGPTSATPPFVGLVVVALGLGSAFNRTTTFAAMPLGLGRTAARCGFAEAVTFVALLTLAPQTDSLFFKLGLAAFAALALLPAAAAISRRLAASSLEVWGRPFVHVIPFLATSACVLFLATTWGVSPLLKILALIFCGVIALFNIHSWQKARPTLCPIWKEESPSLC